MTVRTIKSIAVIGAGTMGSGITIAALDAGFEVALLEQDAGALDRGVGRIHGHYARRVESGKVAQAVAAANQARLTPTTDWNALASVDLVIEAVFEDMAVKREVFARIDGIARPGAILATNTSYLDVDQIAATTSRPQDVIGLHFFSPANVMRLVEVVRATHSAPDAVETGVRLAERMGKVPVVAGNAFGFIGNRIFTAYRRECEFMIEEGAWPEEVDAAIEGFGFAMGPFAVADLAGLDIAWRMRKAQAATRDPSARYVHIADRLCEAGRLGRKTGAGYYTYQEGTKERRSDALVREVIERASAEKGLVRRSLAPEEIQRRALGAMVDEARKVLAEGVAASAADIDTVLVAGYGFPRTKGGPLAWAKA